MQNERITSSLIEFSVENFGCFRDKVTFSMATRADAKNTFHLKKTDDHLLKTSIIYGANASGKSTLIKAMRFMDFKIRRSIDEEHIENLETNPFLLQEGYSEKSSFFEIIFALEKDIFRYSFSVLPDHKILNERLIKINKSKEEILFNRTEKNIEVSAKFIKDKNINQESTRPDTLYLSLSSLLNVSLARKITSFFRIGLKFINASSTKPFIAMTGEMSEKSPIFKKNIIKILQKFDFCLEDFDIVEKNIEIYSKEEGEKIVKKMKSISFQHNVYNNQNEKIKKTDIDFAKQSEGTKKLFEELGPILDTLETGKILIIDELNTSLHPTLLKAVVDLFHSEETNPHNAQLIFTTHETSLLAYAKEEIDRDQFWFTERDNYGRATLFSLAEFKERKDSANIDKKYLKGAYGAIPFINNIDPSLLSE